MERTGAKKEIIVSVTNDLLTDQRAHKVCISLMNAGYRPILVGRKFRSSTPLKREYRIHRMQLIFKRSFLFYAEYNLRLFLYLLFSKGILFLSNDTDTLPANYLVSKLRKIPLVFDAHELFPEVPEITNRPFVKGFWTKIEDAIFPKLQYSYTVCQSIADYYHQKYGIRMQVVRNIPFESTSASTTKKPIDSGGKHVLLYQGAVNQGRGIEWMIDAMPLLDDCVFYIAGDGDTMQEMQLRSQQKGVTDSVKFLGRIPLEDLASYTACADVGISLLENKGLNYYFSLPNRIFDFIRKNIPILASDFPEIRKIISHYGIGILIDQHEPHLLASMIRKLLVAEKNEQGFTRANAELTWENESKILIGIIHQASK